MAKNVFFEERFSRRNPYDFIDQVNSQIRANLMEVFIRIPLEYGSVAGFIRFFF